jgi:hypothetical protein
MSPKYLNPYSFVGTNYREGMNSIAGKLSAVYPQQTIDDVVNAVYDYVNDTYSLNTGDQQSLAMEQGLKGFIYSLLNAYLNPSSVQLQGMDAMQVSYATSLMDGIISAGDPQNIKQNILDIEEQIARSPLSADQQKPLLYATSIGNSAYDYWANVIGNGSGSGSGSGQGSGSGAPAEWTPFITSFTPPIVKFPYWVGSAVQGSLIGSSMLEQYPSSVKSGLLSSTLQLVLDVVGANTILSLFGSLSVNTAKVVFNYEPSLNASSPSGCYTPDMPPSIDMGSLPSPCGCGSH